MIDRMKARCSGGGSKRTDSRSPRSSRAYPKNTRTVRAPRTSVVRMPTSHAENMIMMGIAATPFPRNPAV